MSNDLYQRKDLERRIASSRKRRKKQLHRRILLFTSIMLIAVCFLFGGFRRKIRNSGAAQAREVQEEDIEQSNEGRDKDSVPVSQIVIGDAKNDSSDEEELDRRTAILSNAEAYPQELVEMVSKNAETADFVYEYAQKKDIPCAETVGEVQKGTIPLLQQWDERWGYAQYGDGLIGYTGCGPTCISMVAAGLTGDASITPYRVAVYAEQNGYYQTGAGSSWLLMSQGAAAFGVTGQEITPNESEVIGLLESGVPIICSMGPGDFTDNGHFIVLTGVQDGKIKLNDPNSKSRSSTLWDFSTLQGQITNLWAFYAV